MSSKPPKDRRPPAGPVREDHIGSRRRGSGPPDRHGAPRRRPSAPTGRAHRAAATAEPIEDGLILTGVRGLEGLLAEEAVSLGFAVDEVLAGAVRLHVPAAERMQEAMRACLWLRCAEQVIAPIATARVGAPGDLVPALAAMPLAEHFGPDHTLAVAATVRQDDGPPPHLLGLRVKDAIMDQLRDRHGRRPFVDRDDPDIGVSAHLEDGRVTVGLRLQGAPLHRRGYRGHGGPAPVRETIAAALLRFSGWDGHVPLCDPMCGSGTIAIEAAAMATGTAPGLGRSFGFERWPGFTALETSWSRLRQDAQEVRRDRAVPIFARDADPRAVAATRRHATAAGFRDLIYVEHGPVDTLQPLDPPGFIVANPPWGERLDGEEDEDGIEAAREIHAALGAAVRRCEGHTLALLTRKAVAVGSVPMRPDTTLSFRNGPLTVQFARYTVGSDSADKPSEVS